MSSFNNDDECSGAADNINMNSSNRNHFRGGPIEYTNARSQGRRLDRFVIDGRPYCPSLVVDVKDPETVTRVVGKMFDLSDTSMLSTQRISGGITNILFKVENLDVTIGEQKIRSVLVRVFGAEGMIDRDVENSTYAALSAAELAPAYYGRFGNGRLEGWLDMRPVKVRELSDPSISNAIAKATGTFHSRFNVPKHLQDHHSHSKPSLWIQLESWFNQASYSTFQNENDTKRANSLNILQLRDELEWLKSKVIPSNAEVGFCHNDILAANVLWDERQKRAQLIDFEYGGINFLSFDIANHFNEFAGGTEDGDGVPRYEWLPTKEQRLVFVAQYLQSRFSPENDATKISKDQIESVLKEVDAFMLVNHLYWGLWAVNQAAMEGCDSFDYLLYATNRIKQYGISKADFLVRTRISS
jgi:ethanolamine kinase